MTFTAPLGLLALLAVPAVLVLHLFRRRLPERRIAALFLFAPQSLVADAGRRRTRLLNTPSLWLQCLAALLFALWLAGLSFGGKATTHLVVVLDDSASMSADGCAQRVVARVQQRVRELANGDLVTILRTGPQPTILLGPRARPDAVDEALRSWHPTRERHDFAPTLAFARELSRDGEVMFCTDAAPLVAADDVTWIACGEAAPNAAILTTDRAPAPDGSERVRARVAAFGAVGATTLSLLDGEHELVRQLLEFHDGVADVEARVPSSLRTLCLRLTPDTMPIDDVAWLSPSPPRVVRVCNLLSAELQAALQWPRLLAALPGCELVADPRRAQLLVATEPGALLPGQTEVVLASGDGERLLTASASVVDRAHEWLQGVQLDGVSWCFERRHLPGLALVISGDEVLASEEFLDVGRRLWLELDAAAGNLPRSPDWPILLANVVESCRRAVPGPDQLDVLVGHEARYRRAPFVGAADAQPVLVTPDGVRHDLPPRAVLAFVPEQIGVHRLLGGDGVELASYSARFFDASESDLRGLGTMQRDAVAVAADDRTAIARDTAIERRLLAAALLLSVLLDWWLARRRHA